MHSNDSFVIDTRGLTKSYKGVAALADLDLKVPRNSIFGFLGPNGAGKSTTIKLLLGLIKPTGGSATIFGRAIHALIDTTFPREALAAAITEQGIRIEELRPLTPSLEDVFVELTERRQKELEEA